MKKYFTFRFGILSLFVVAILFFVTVGGFANTPDGSSGAPAGQGGAGTPPAGSPPAGQQPDPNTIAATARKEFLAELGFESEEDVKKARDAWKKQSKPKPKKSTDPKTEGDGEGEGEDDETKVRNKYLEDENKKLASELEKQKLDNAIENALSAIPQKFHNREQFKKIVSERVASNKDGEIIIKGDDGKAIIGNNGLKKTLSEYIAECLKTHSYMIKTDVKGGAGIPPSGKSTVNAGDTKTQTIREGLKGTISDLLSKV